MTSFVRFFGIKAITISAALSMTAGLAFAGDTPSKNSIVDALRAPPRTRSLSSFDGKKAAADKTINSMRNRATRSLTMDDRSKLEVAVADRPKIDLEINFEYNSASISSASMSAVQHLGEA